MVKIYYVIMFFFLQSFFYANDIQSIPFDVTSPEVIRESAGSISLKDNRAVFIFTNSSTNSSDIRIFRLPADGLNDRFVLIKASVKGGSIGSKPFPWNGIKVMLKIDTPEGVQWPQINFPEGTFGPSNFSGKFYIPPEMTNLHLVLGLEKVTGIAEISDISLEALPPQPDVPAAPSGQPIYKGHAGTLRGAMIYPFMSREDFDVLTKDWGANLVRWQLIRPAGQTGDYDAWLDGMLQKLDAALTWARENGTYIVVDLHSPPGGGNSPGGYQDASGGLFTSREAQEHFIEVWRKIAGRYKGNSLIWGFDLVNEPMDEGTSDDCLDWNSLALKAGQAVREIDPGRNLIIEPGMTGSPQGFIRFRPLPLSNVIYSFHMYIPGEFTHQGVFYPSKPVFYPGSINGVEWNKETLLKALKPAMDFAARYRVQMYVGEFSAIRWAPGADRYLSDLVDIFDDQGWDWSYHAFREWQGWSLEFSTNINDREPENNEGERMKIILGEFSKNNKDK